MGVYKRGGVYWYKFKWTVKTSDGNRDSFVIRRTGHTSIKRKAEEVEDEHKRALRLGQIHPLDPWPQPPGAQSPSLRDFADRFEKHAELHTKPRTACFYKDCLRRIKGFAPLADKPLSNITGELVDKYVNWRKGLDSGNSLASLNGELRTLRRLFRLAEEWAVVERAPAIHELPGAAGRDRVISFHEEAHYLTEAAPTLRDLTTLAVDTGLRPNSELFILEWANTCLHPSANGPYGYIRVVSGKTASAVRNVPLTPRTQAILEMRCTKSGSCRYVFPGRGKSGHITTVQHAHERAIRRWNEKARMQGLQKAEIEPFEFYCWRHTFGTRCAESGMDKFSLARLMGHSSPSVAERYYIHVTEPHVAAGFERFLEYQARQIVESVPLATERVQ